MSGRVTMRYISRPMSRLYLTGSFSNSPSSGVSFRYCSIETNQLLKILILSENKLQHQTKANKDRLKDQDTNQKQKMGVSHGWGLPTKCLTMHDKDSTPARIFYSLNKLFTSSSLTAQKQHNTLLTAISCLCILTLITILFSSTLQVVT